jgi:hypothetical protein
MIITNSSSFYFQICHMNVALSKSSDVLLSIIGLYVTTWNLPILDKAQRI